MKTGYKQTEVGVIPEDWDSKPLGELLVRLCNGAVYKPTSGFGLPVTRIETIADGTIDLSCVGSAAQTTQIEA